MKETIRWTLFTGTWRTTNEEVEKDVREAVRKTIGKGNGVLTGGATGVDYFAMEESLKTNPDASLLKVVIPAFLSDYLADYYKNWCQKPITEKHIDSLANLLKRLKELRPSSLIEMPNKIITQEHYDLRSEQEVINSDAICAFQINNSQGTEWTLNHARKMGIPIILHKNYLIRE